MKYPVLHVILASCCNKNNVCNTVAKSLIARFALLKPHMRSTLAFYANNNTF